MHMMCCGVAYSILNVDIIFDNTLIGGFSTEFDVDSSMESIWNSTWIYNVDSLEIPWNPHELVHGMSMEWAIPYGIHMDSIVGMEWKNG